LVVAGLLAACSDDSGKKDSKVGPVDMAQVDTTVDMGVDLPPGEGPVVFNDSGPDQTPIVDGPVVIDGAAPGNDKCASPQVLTWAGTTVTVQLDTTNATNDLDLGLSGSCTGDETPGPDLFYQIQLAPGTYVIKLKVDPSVDPALYVLTGCSPGACVQGSDIPYDGADEEVTLTVTTTTTYIIAVDSYDTAVYGPATLEISVGTPTDAGPDTFTPDTMPVDAGPPTDADLQVPDTTPPTDGTPFPGQIVITEIMADPVTVTDANGEWFELYNAGSAVVNLKNWTIKDNGSDSHVIASDVLIQPGAYAVLGNNSDSGTNGGVTVAYAYPTSWYLGNSNDDEVLLLDPQNNVVDQITWDKSQGWTMFVAGASISLKSTTADNNVAANWCTSPTAWASGDKGSPGVVNNCP